MLIQRLGLAALLAAFAAPAAATILAGGNVDIDEPVSGNLYVAGGNVTVSAPVEGHARIAGGDVTIKGRIGGRLAVAGGNVRIDAPVAGNATVSGGTLELGPNARIEGELEFRGGHLEQDAAAQVVGGVKQTRRHRSNWGDGTWNGGSRWARTITGAVWTAGLMLLAALIAGALPGATRRMQDELRTQPWLAALFGFLALICIPIGAVLVMITVIGIPIGLLALFGYVALLLVGYVSASVVLSGLLLDRYKAEVAARTAWRVGAAVLAMLVIALLARVPVVGGAVALAALVIGVGVIVAAAVHRTRPAATATAA